MSTFLIYILKVISKFMVVGHGGIVLQSSKAWNFKVKWNYILKEDNLLFQVDEERDKDKKNCEMFVRKKSQDSFCLWHWGLNQVSHSFQASILLLSYTISPFIIFIALFLLVVYCMLNISPSETQVFTHSTPF